MTQGTSRGPLPSPQFVANALGIHPAGPPDPRPFERVTTDSRKVIPGALFVALPGEKFDGHDFIDAAVRSGARAVLCRKNRAPAPTAELRVFGVDDPLAAYRKVAKAWRQEFEYPVIAVAGSVGKTTTKELLASVLEGRWPGKVLKTTGSQNGFIGIPMTLLEMRLDHGAAVIEVGIDEIGAMTQHMPLVDPTAALLTAIGPEHLEKLVDIPTVAREEGIALTHTAKEGGITVVNLDDEWIRPFMTTLRSGKKFGFTLASERKGENILLGTLDANGARIRIEGATFGSENFELPLPGRHNAVNFLSAVTMAHALGLSAEEIRRGLSGFRAAEGRSQLKKLPDGTQVLCDYYNANPTSTVAALATLEELRRKAPVEAKYWACLADMLELGPDEERFHREFAQPLIASGIENVLLFGPRMRWLAEELTRQGFKGRSAHFDDQSQLATSLKKQSRPGDVILIKGSRGMKMEEVFKALDKEGS